MYYLWMHSRPLLHADCDAFFASVALRTRPELIGLPVAVVAHVFVASATYAARAFGVRGGMLVQEALARCPEMVLLDIPRVEVEEAGDALFDLFDELAVGVEPGSQEEAFLQMPSADWDEAIAIGRELRRRAAVDLGIPVSVGVGRTKLMAKLASRAAKPDGLYVIDGDREQELRSGLDIADIWGIGPRTVKRLAGLDVVRLSDLDRMSRVELPQVCGSAVARRLWAIREGTDDAHVRPLRSRESFSAEGSVAGFQRPDRDPQELLEQCGTRVCHRTARAGLAGNRLAITLKPETGPPVVLRCTLAEASASWAAWAGPARKLLADRPLLPLIGLGVTLSALVPADQVQVALF